MRKIPSRIIFATLVLLGGFGPPAAAAAAYTLRVGAAKVEITPAKLNKLEPITLGGGDFESVHDAIYARALVMDSGSGLTAIVALDAVHLMDMLALRQRIQRELGIPVDHIVVTASHDHSAPRIGGGGPFWRPVLPEQDAYMVQTYDRIVEAAKRAKASMKPARLGIGTGSVDVNVNRDQYVARRGWGAGYNPAGKSDKTVWVSKFETLEGEPIAVLFNYAVHSIVTMSTKVVSGDLAGAAANVVERHYGGNAVALFTMGAAGDQNPRFSGTIPGPSRPSNGGARGARPVDLAERRRLAFAAMDAQGFMLGSEVVRVANEIHADNAAPRIFASESMFTCPAKPEKQKDAYSYQDFSAGVPVRIGAIVIDETAYAWVSGEVVTNIYWRLRRESPLVNTIMLTLSNGRSGYMVDDATYDTPNFEVNTTPLLRGCVEDGVVTGLVKLIRQASLPAGSTWTN